MDGVPDSLNTDSSETNDRAFMHWAAREHEVRLRRDRLRRDPIQNALCVADKTRAEEHHRRKTVEATAAKLGIKRAITRIEAQRINEQLLSLALDLIAAQVAMKAPSLPAGCATCGHPINQNQIRRRAQQKPLPLLIARLRKALHRIGRENEQSIIANGSGEFMRTRQPGRIAINLRGSLCAEKATRPRIHSDIQPRAIARNHSKRFRLATVA